VSGEDEDTPQERLTPLTLAQRAKRIEHIARGARTAAQAAERASKALARRVDAVLALRIVDVALPSLLVGLLLGGVLCWLLGR
jgi:hypothetical protein